MPSTRQNPRATPAPDLVNRQFTAAAPDRLWVADASRIPCGEGAFWLATVRDAFSNRIVGWKAGDRCNTDLILAALEYGIWSRDVRNGQLIHHSDRGSNYTSFRFSQRLTDNGIRPSMGSVGDSFDNALMENFWSTLKIELVYRTSWRTRDEAENAIFTYIDTWYNTRRIQRELAGYVWRGVQMLSFGLADAAGLDWAEALRRADIAMYHAKTDGEPRVFAPGMRHPATPPPGQRRTRLRDLPAPSDLPGDHDA
ncbi:IS3 family transposase [Dactylosporangium sp. NPDC000244]|uniref:IS3 family transposase n=1 Tax=Dactylosporangium sp. NPDC000244 TaxID=3154365 RepID=UPI003324388B